MSKSFLQDIVVNNISQGFQFGSRWLLNIALITILDIEKYALFSFIYSLSNILLSVLPFGSSTYLIANASNNRSGIRALIQSNAIITILIAMLLIFYFVLTPFLYTLNGWNYAIYGIILSYLLSLNLVSFSYFKGLGQFNQELKAYSVFGAGILLFTGYSYFVTEEIEDIRVIFFVLIGLNTIIVGYTYLFTELREKLTFSFGSWMVTYKEILNELHKRKYFGLQDIVTAIYTQAGLLILFYIIDERTYGYYRALFVIVAPIFMITVAISQVILNRFANSNKQNILSLFRNVQRYTIILGILICMVLLFMKKIILSFINIDINQTSLISFFVIVAITFMRFVFSNYEMLLVVYDMQKQRFMTMAIAALLGIFSIFVLLPRFGLVGAVSTNAVSYTIVLVGLVIISELKIRRLKR